VFNAADVYKRRREKILNLRSRNERLSSRERAIKTINHEEPDRIPIDVWVSQQIREGMMGYWGFDDWEHCLQFLGADFRYWRGSNYAGQESGTPGGGVIEDHWGVRRRVVEIGEGSSWNAAIPNMARYRLLSPMPSLNNAVSRAHVGA